MNTQESQRNDNEGGLADTKTAGPPAPLDYLDWLTTYLRSTPTERLVPIEGEVAGGKAGQMDSPEGRLTWTRCVLEGWRMNLDEWLNDKPHVTERMVKDDRTGRWGKEVTTWPLNARYLALAGPVYLEDVKAYRARVEGVLGGGK